MKTILALSLSSVLIFSGYAYADEPLEDDAIEAENAESVSDDDALGDPEEGIEELGENIEYGYSVEKEPYGHEIEDADLELVSSEPIRIDPEQEEYFTGAEIKLVPNIEDISETARYKYVWMKENWKSWGVLRAASSEPEVLWTPEQPGRYTIYLDIIDTDDTYVTYTLDIEIELAWNAESIAFSTDSPHDGEEILVQAETYFMSVETQPLDYKFVWEKDGWKHWGVIRDFDANPDAFWTPSTGRGTYTVYVDVKDEYGNAKTLTESINVRDNWTFDEAIVDSSSGATTNHQIVLHSIASGNSDDLQYKFVWMQDNWKQWGVLQEAGPENSCVWIPENPGTYTLYFDVIDQDGVTETKSKTLTVALPWSHQGVTVQDALIAISDPVQIAVAVDGDVAELECKLVWEKDGWKQWGVISDFSEVFELEWTPETGAGTYTIYADVHDSNGNTATEKTTFKYTDEWVFEGIAVNPTSGWGIGETISIEAKTSGNVQGLSYKFVWQRNGSWAKDDWGVIGGPDAQSSIEWTIPDAKNVRIYVDVISLGGKTETKYINLSPLKTTIWHIDEIKADNASIELGETANIEVLTSGQTDDLVYKFVWQRNGSWASGNWGVGKNFSKDNTFTTKPDRPGDYTIYVDVKGDDGIVETKTFDLHVWTEPKSVNVTVKNGIATIRPDFGCTLTENPGFTFKYVWAFNGWMHWGSIFTDPEFVEDMSASVPLDYCGNYTFYIDVQYPDGSMRTFSASLSYDNLLEKIGGMGMGRTISYFGGYSGLSANAKSKLQTAIRGFEGDGYDVGVVIMDLQTGHGVQYNANQYFYSASTIKGPYVAALCRYIPSSASSWSGTMTNTIEWSSNEDYGALRDEFGGWPMEKIMADSNIGKYTWGASAWYVDYRPYDLARLWITMYRYFNSGEANARWCSNLFTSSYNSRGYEVLSGGGTTTRTKPGWTGFSYPDDMQVYNDAGIVSRNGHDYLYVVLSEDCTMGYNMTRMIYAIDSVSYELR